jgi:hypothetical protein
MEPIIEIASLGISSILFGICYKRYVGQRNAIDGVQVCIKLMGSPEQTAAAIKNLKFSWTPHLTAL